MVGNQHTSKQYDAELESLRERVLLMGELVARRVQLAIEALNKGDMGLINRVIADDHHVYTLEAGIDQSCCQIVARRQPAANDLRMLMMVIKTITGLKRIGDEAKAIAITAGILSQRKNLTLPRFDNIKYMANLTLDMLRKSLDAFASLEISDVAQVARQDGQADEEFRIIMRHLATFMMENPRTISNALEILFVAKAIRHIADHARNMSEYVIYMVKGCDTRHNTAAEIDREIRQ